MQTLWIEFSSNIVSAWKTAEKTIAKGIGYLIAKMEGLDPDEMSRTIEEDYKRESQQRETAKSTKLSDIQSKRDEKMASLEADKKGTLDILRDDFERQAGERTGQFAGKIAERENELAAAKEAYLAAIDRAKNPPQTPEIGDEETLEEKLRKKVAQLMNGLNAGLEEKVSVTGSFSAAAIQAMGVGGGPMERVAKATERSEKHLEKIANKEDNPVVPQNAENDGEGNDDRDDGELAREMKIQTRLLRNIADGGVAFA